MKELPILFDAPMVLALLDGSNTQIRRLVKPQPEFEHESQGVAFYRWRNNLLTDPVGIQATLPSFCPYCMPGDRLWVRETWGTQTMFDDLSPRELPQDAALFYYADGSFSDEIFEPSALTRPSMSMPRWASRISLDVVSVQVERLQTISYADADAMKVNRLDAMHAIRRMYGSERSRTASPRGNRNVVWHAVKGIDSWEENPWIWVIEFRFLGQTRLALDPQAADVMPEVHNSKDCYRCRNR